MKLACLDVAGSRNLDAVWVSDGDRVVQHGLLPTPKAVLEWVEKNLPDVVAIDAPSKRNLGRTQDVSVRQTHKLQGDTYRNCRVCEALLKQRGIGLYYTTQENPAKWIEVGWEIYDGLVAMGYRLWDTPGAVTLPQGWRTVLEIHPHACFVVGLGWIPQDKKNLAGQLERTAYLREAAALRGQPLVGDPIPANDVLTRIGNKLLASSWQAIRAQGISLPPLPHDRLDALGGLVTVIAAVEGRAFAVGETEEGVIVVPREPQPVGQPYRRRRGN